MPLELETLPREKKKKKYLYDGDWFPIVEYKVSRSQSYEETGSVIPSFVLDVTWPRLIQFYHPSSVACQELQQGYWNMTYSLKHKTEIPVQFYTVNCATHIQACQELSIQSVPTILAYPIGSIEGKPISPSKAIQNDNIVMVADTLDIDISSLHQQQHELPDVLLLQKQTREISPDSPNYDDDYYTTQTDNNRKKKNHSVSREDTLYADASISFFKMLLHLSDNQLIDTKNKEQVIHDFLDLCHWTLPSSWKIHDVLNDLRNDWIPALENSNNDNIMEDEDDIRTILNRHENGIVDQLSSMQHNNNNGCSVSCGIWKFLHILSVGIQEQPKNRILGDFHRVNPSYASSVIRDFIYEFVENTHDAIFANGCRDRIVQSYDNCDTIIHQQDDDTTTTDKDNNHYDENNPQKDQNLMLSSLCSPKFQSITKDDTNTNIFEWRLISIWLWQIHNESKQQIQYNNKENDNHSKKQEEWPKKQDCPSCRINIEWNVDNVYEHLKHVYWPPNQQTGSRITVLQKFVRTERIQNDQQFWKRSYSSFFITSGSILYTIFILSFAAFIFWIISKFLFQTDSILNKIVMKTKNTSSLFRRNNNKKKSKQKYHRYHTREVPHASPIDMGQYNFYDKSINPQRVKPYHSLSIRDSKTNETLNYRVKRHSIQTMF